MIEITASEPAHEVAARDPVARRRQSWRAAQKARRERQRAKGKALLRLWVTEAEAAAAREAVKKIRRAALLRRLEQRAQQHAMGSEGSHLKCNPLRPGNAMTRHPMPSIDAERLEGLTRRLTPPTRARETDRSASIHYPRKAGERHD